MATADNLPKAQMTQQAPTVAEPAAHEPEPVQRLEALEIALGPFYGDKIREALAGIVKRDSADGGTTGEG